MPAIVYKGGCCATSCELASSPNLESRSSFGIMHSTQMISWLFCLYLASLVSTLAISPPVAHGSIDKRTINQGWSLQASICPSEDTSCGNGACCPSSLFCIAAANDEVDACCTTNSACRGSIEGYPVCADSSWSLWKGFQG
jgi:hypothetical protein